ncbi:TrkA family potassium uptake protein [Heliorestis acidaminivorans]|uniref:TrkA family potassium uptake protein n=1 Tax=Heliorestis acidaminivorans TaxID=553427 RepID=A0A6I0ETC7_9FIRM|nr:TrkA family potassium uptake protein [Heliorestis acidaminivorans]KAB2953319.1 TrkA family potassium uptake protein [Heliorestis acidaminivorans]
MKKKSVLVIGVGRFGRGVIQGLYERGHDIFAIDIDEEALDHVRDMIVSGAVLDVGEDDEELIRIVGEKNFDEAVVALGADFEGALVSTHILKEAGVRVSVKASNERRGSVLEKMGAENVVYPERDIGLRLAQMISTESKIDILEMPQGFVVEQMEVGKGYEGKSIRDLNTTNRFGVSFLMIYHNDEPIQPKADTVLCRGDLIVVFGQKSKMHLFENENFG